MGHAALVEGAVHQVGQEGPIVRPSLTSTQQAQVCALYSSSDQLLSLHVKRLCRLLGKEQVLVNKQNGGAAVPDPVRDKSSGQRAEVEIERFRAGQGDTSVQKKES